MIIRRLAPACALAGLLFLAATASAGGPALKTHVMVEDGHIRVGDLFYNAGEHADRVIAQAPPPGRRVVLDANWLYRVAHAYKIGWRPTSILDQATIERASQTIGADRMADILIPALQDDMASLDPLEVEFDNRTVQIHLPTTVSATLSLGKLDFDRRANRFAAVLVAAEGQPDAVRIAVTGRAHRMIQVPVPTRRIRPGEVIGERDIDYMTLREDAIDRTAFLEAEQIVGMSPRRLLDERRPVRANDIQRPVLVQRGALVTILYRTPHMMLTARGRATQDGAAGDTVRVTNLNSRQTIEAVVTPSGDVSVTPTGRLAMQ